MLQIDHINTGKHIGCGAGDGIGMSGTLLGMVLLRLFSGTVEIVAALIIFRLNSLEQALKINATLASIGPLVFLAAMYLGLTGLAREVPFQKMVFIYLGVALIFIGLRR